jgi:hypothetical protein
MKIASKFLTQLDAVKRHSSTTTNLIPGRIQYLKKLAEGKLL